METHLKLSNGKTIFIEHSQELNLVEGDIINIPSIMEDVIITQIWKSVSDIIKIQGPSYNREFLAPTGL